MGIWIRYQATQGGAFTEYQLRPNPTNVDYPERRDYKVQTTEDGAAVIQRPLRDSRIRSWIWKGYKPAITAYETQWQFLKTLEYRYRVQNGLYPIVAVWDGDSGVGDLDTLNVDTTRLYTAARIIQVSRKPRDNDGKTFEDSTLQFVIEDAAFAGF